MAKAHWSVAGAKAALSQVIHEAESEPQIIEKRGEPVAVVVSFADYQVALGDSTSGSIRGTQWRHFLAKCAERSGRRGAALRLPRREPRPDPFRSSR